MSAGGGGLSPASHAQSTPLCVLQLEKELAEARDVAHANLRRAEAAEGKVKAAEQAQKCGAPFPCVRMIVVVSTTS